MFLHSVDKRAPGASRKFELLTPHYVSLINTSHPYLGQGSVADFQASTDISVKLS